MAELKPSALLFSLGACLERERERSALARAQADLARAIERRDRTEAEKSRLEEALAQERLLSRSRVEEARRLEQRAKRLVEQRLEELERASRDAKARAELEIVALDKAHERRLMEIQLATARTKNRMIAALVAMVFVTGLATSGSLYFGRLRPEAERADALSAELRSERARANEAERLYAELRRRNAELVREIDRSQRARDGALPARVAR